MYRDIQVVAVTRSELVWLLGLESGWCVGPWDRVIGACVGVWAATSWCVGTGCEWAGGVASCFVGSFARLVRPGGLVPFGRSEPAGTASVAVGSGFWPDSSTSKSVVVAGVSSSEIMVAAFFAHFLNFHMTEVKQETPLTHSVWSELCLLMGELSVSPTLALVLFTFY